MKARDNMGEPFFFFLCCQLSSVIVFETLNVLTGNIRTVQINELHRFTHHGQRLNDKVR